MQTLNICGVIGPKLNNPVKMLKNCSMLDDLKINQPTEKTAIV